MSRKTLVARALAGLAVAATGSALAFSDLHFSPGTVAEYDFGGFGPGHPIPGIVVIEGFTMKPGDSVGWHYHKGLSYVIVLRGTVTEQDLEGPGQCVERQDMPGSAFVEGPGHVHNVTNRGTGVAIIWWATIFPESDGIEADGTYPVEAPDCR